MKQLIINNITGEAIEVDLEATQEYIGSLTPQETIEDLKIQLESTDYKIVKCMEYQLAGLPLPYDIEALHLQRQAIRDKIAELEVV